jgi:N-acetylglucosaminyldiphosphoundecaprenol N-acetyl-beta-D-mannosaminyltransferase
VSYFSEALQHMDRKKTDLNRSKFLTASVDSVSMEEAIDRVQEFIKSRAPHLVVALNVPKLWRMQRDLRLRRIVEMADMILPEQVIVLTSRLCGNSLKAYIGNDRLTQALLPLAAERGQRLFFLGTRPSALEQIAARLREQYPGVIIAGCHDGFFTEAEAEKVVQQIRDSQADILFVGMGTPTQEYWMESYGRHLNVPVVIGVGGTLDVLAGIKRHCPNWIRTVGLEWVYRIFEDPRGKLNRYVVALPWFVWALFVRGILSRWCLTQNVSEH